MNDFSNVRLFLDVVKKCKGGCLTSPNVQEAQVTVGEYLFVSILFIIWLTGMETTVCGRCKIIASLFPRSKKLDLQYKWHHNSL